MTGQADDADTPRFVVVDAWGGRSWRRLGPTGQVGPFTHWTGTRLVDADPTHATGLAGDPPQGGFLDPATGDWSPLGGPFDDEGPSFEGWRPVAESGPHVASWGYAYDDRDRRWSLLGRPSRSAVVDQQGAAWMDETLVVVGGVDENGVGLSREAWVWSG